MEIINTIGRRKTSIARVYLKPGNGQIIVNDRPLDNYFPSDILQTTVRQGLTLTHQTEQYDVKVTVEGGGIKGQAEAIRLGISHALVKLNAENCPPLKKEGLLTRDSRMVERKKPGRRKARRKFQFSSVNNMSEKLTVEQLKEAGVHFGHLTRKWNPKMAEYIFMENNGIHLIDLNKTAKCLDEAVYALKNIIRSGRKIMFVATKKQAKDIIQTEATRLNMPYVTERWLGGMLTNFATIRKSLKKLSQIEKLLKDETSYGNLTKKEKLMLSREKAKLQKQLGGIADLNRLPAA